MKCSKCGATLEDGVRFCRECGNKIETVVQPKFCRECGSALIAGSKFCANCGTKVMMEVDLVEDTKVVDLTQKHNQAPEATQNQDADQHQDKADNLQHNQTSKPQNIVAERIEKYGGRTINKEAVSEKIMGMMKTADIDANMDRLIGRLSDEINKVSDRVGEFTFDNRAKEKTAEHIEESENNETEANSSVIPEFIKKNSFEEPEVSSGRELEEVDAESGNDLKDPEGGQQDAPQIVNEIAEEEQKQYLHGATLAEMYGAEIDGAYKREESVEHKGEYSDSITGILFDSIKNGKSLTSPEYKERMLNIVENTVEKGKRKSKNFWDSLDLFCKLSFIVACIALLNFVIGLLMHSAALLFALYSIVFVGIGVITHFKNKDKKSKADYGWLLAAAVMVLLTLLPLTDGNKQKAVEDNPENTVAPVATAKAPDLVNVTVQYEVNREGNAVVVGYSGSGNYAEIASEYEGHKVVEIKESAFKGFTDLYKVAMWASIEKIGDYAFKDCTSLVDINISNDCIEVGKHAFENCISLEHLYIWGSPDIRDYAFAGCLSLKTIDIPAGTKLIGPNAFEGCRSADSVRLQGGEEIGSYAFAKCSSIEKIKFTENTKLVRTHAFDSCTELKEVVYIDDQTKFEIDAFSNCQNLTEVPPGIEITDQGGEIAQDSRPQKNGFDSSTNEVYDLGAYTIEIPTYWQNEQIFDGEMSRTAESNGKAAFIIIKASGQSDDSLAASYEFMLAINDELIESLEESGFDKIDQYTEIDNGFVKGILYKGQLKDAKISNESYIFMFPSGEDRKWCLIDLTQSDNTEYSYKEDFMKMIYSIKPKDGTVQSPQSDAVNVGATVSTAESTPSSAPTSTQDTASEFQSKIILPETNSKLGRDYDSKSSSTIIYINVDGKKNKPSLAKYGNATVTDGVAEYLKSLESQGVKVKVTDSSSKTPYTGFTYYEASFTASNGGVSWEMYSMIQSEDYIEYEFDIYLE